MAAVQHLVRLARSYRLLCVPAALSPCTCDAGAGDCCTIVASVCCVLVPTINGTFVMGHGFLSLTSTCHVTHVLYFKNNVKFDCCPHSCVLDHNITMPMHWLAAPACTNHRTLELPYNKVMNTAVFVCVCVCVCVCARTRACMHACVWRGKERSGTTVTLYTHKE